MSCEFFLCWWFKFYKLLSECIRLLLGIPPPSSTFPCPDIARVVYSSYTLSTDAVLPGISWYWGLSGTETHTFTNKLILKSNPSPPWSYYSVWARLMIGEGWVGGEDPAPGSLTYTQVRIMISASPNYFHRLVL